MPQAKVQWLFVLDAAGGRLLQVEAVPAGRLHLRERARVLNPRHEHVRGGIPHPSTRNKYEPAYEKQLPEERERQWAREAVDWLEEQLAAKTIDRVLLCCGPAIMGALRAAAGAGTARAAVWCPHDLSGLSDGELAVHPAVVSALAQ